MVIGVVAGGAAVTVMVKVCEALNAGLPLSVTVTVTEYGVALACPVAGVQLKAPVVAFRVAPVGRVAPAENVNALPSGSLPVIVNDSG